MSNPLETTIADLRRHVDPVERRYPEIDVVFELHRLLQAEAYSDEDDTFLDQAARRIDISNRLFTHYNNDWRKQSSEQVGDPWLGVLALLIYRRIFARREAGASNSEVLKQLNVLLKCIDLSASDYFAESSSLRQEVDSEVCSSSETIERAAIKPHQVKVASTAALREIGLTVLFYEGPIARAYLETIRSMGLKPQRIINLVAARDIATKKPVGRWLPVSMRRHYAANIQQRKIHYWSRHIRRSSPELLSEIDGWVAANFGFEQSTLKAALQMSDLSTYSDRVDELLVDGLKDPALSGYMNELPETALLFTGGGIVPNSLLDIPSIRMLHIHPGYLPDIRGADCVLWSVLLTGLSSASSFYLAPGIDTGDVVMARWLPKPEFGAETEKYGTTTLYRAVYACYDPWVRACVLRETLDAHDDYFSMPSMRQNETSGTQFHFMHDKMREIALNSLFHK